MMEQETDDKNSRGFRYFRIPGSFIFSDFYTFEGSEH